MSTLPFVSMPSIFASFYSSMDCKNDLHFENKTVNIKLYGACFVVDTVSAALYLYRVILICVDPETSFLDWGSEFQSKNLSFVFTQATAVACR